MPGYHSRIRSKNYQIIGNLALLTFQNSTKGPIQALNDEHLSEAVRNLPSMDIIDEVLYYFKANIFLKKYEVETPIDRLFIYLMLYVIECLKKLHNCIRKDQAKICMRNLARSYFQMPGDHNFVLNYMYKVPATKEESIYLCKYLVQIREECGQRLCEFVFKNETEKPSKWWICFAKKKFLNITLN